MSQRPLRAVDSERLGGRELTDAYTQFMESSQRVEGLLSNFVLENQAQEETISALNEELRIVREREQVAQERAAATEELLTSVRTTAAEANAAAEAAHQAATEELRIVREREQVAQERTVATEELLASVRTSAAEATAAAEVTHQAAIEDLRGKAAEAIRRLDQYRRFQIGELEEGHRREVSVLRTGALPAVSPIDSENELGVHELIEIETQKAQYLVDEGEWVDAIVATAKQYTTDQGETLPWARHDTHGRVAVLVLDGDSLAVAGWPDLGLHDARRELVRALVLLAESSVLQMDVLMGSNAAPDLTHDLPLKVRVRILRENVSVGDTLTAISETYADQPSLVVTPDEEFQLAGIAPLKFADALRSLAGNSGQLTTS